MFRLPLDCNEQDTGSHRIQLWHVHSYRSRSTTLSLLAYQLIPVPTRQLPKGHTDSRPHRPSEFVPGPTRCGWSRPTALTQHFAGPMHRIHRLAELTAENVFPHLPSSSWTSTSPAAWSRKPFQPPQRALVKVHPISAVPSLSARHTNAGVASWLTSRCGGWMTPFSLP